MSVLTQSYQCGTWFVCSILRELAVSNLGQPLFCLSITWSRYCNAYRDLWIMTIKVAYPSKINKFEWSIARGLQMAPSDCKHLQHAMPCGMCIQWCGALQWTHWCSYLKRLICSCLASWFFRKATKVGSPPNFPKPISQLWGIHQPHYFVTLLLSPHWTYFWKHYRYYTKDIKVGSQTLATEFGFVPDWSCGNPEENLVSEKKRKKSHPKNYTNGLPLIVFCCGMVSCNFIHAIRVISLV